MLDITHLNFSYPDRPVLRDISFSAVPGQILVILGPNGAGKTTLLKNLNRILPPESGEVLVEGLPVSTMGVRQIARHMAYVAQAPEGGRVTVFDTVLMGRIPHLGFRPSRKDLEKTDAVMTRLGLSAMALKTLDCLSGGERQKVSIARALVQETPILLLDEPTAALDLKNQTDILGLIRHIARDHDMAVVMTMHDINAALQYADQYLCLKDGKILGTGAIEAISPDLIQRVYGVAVDMIFHNGQPMVGADIRHVPGGNRGLTRTQINAIKTKKGESHALCT